MGVSPFALYDRVVGDLANARLLASHDLDVYRHSDVGSINGNGLATDRFAALHLLKALVSKLEPKAGGEADQRAIEKFLAVNERMRNFHLRFDRDDERQAFAYARGHLYEWFERGMVLSQAAISDCARFGPGASSGTKGTSVYEKVSGELRASSDYLARCYTSDMLAQSPSDRAELARVERHGPVTVQPHGDLQCVPKKADISRTISIEPAVNTYYQLGAMELLNRALRKHTGIDLPTQQGRNRQLACVASATGEFFTLDLSSASDSISLELLNALWPRRTRDWLKVLRTPQVCLPDNRIITLGMVGTMGNGTIFTVQTATFCALLWGVYDVLGIKRDNPRDHASALYRKLGNFAVNGDDIIGRAEAYDLMTRVLIACGFEVNTQKSFCATGFNESCGGDYYHGNPVRGVYVKRLVQLEDIYSAFNRLARWSAEHGVALTGSLQYLYDSVKVSKRNHVPPSDDDECGFHMPCPKSGDRYICTFRVERQKRLNIEDLRADGRWCEDAYAYAYLSGCFRPEQVRGAWTLDEAMNAYLCKAKVGKPLSTYLIQRRGREEKRQFVERVVTSSTWPSYEGIRGCAADVAARWTRQLDGLTIR